MVYFKNIYTFCIALIFLGVASSVSQHIHKPSITISKQEDSWHLNTEMIQKFHLGFKRLQSSVIWISTIIESDVEHYKKRDLNSWMFLRFSTISVLEPRFYENYSFGGIYLSVVKDDLEGASVIYQKGLAQYPNDFKLLRDSSYHFFYEAKNFDKAYEISQKIKHLYPEKKYLLGMITKLEAENGRLEDALKGLDHYQLDYPVGNIIGDKIFKSRYALKAEIDLNCLNVLKGNNCSRVDLNNDFYIKTSSGYFAQQKWEPYRRKSLNK